MKINLDLAKDLLLVTLISALFLYLGQGFGFLKPIISNQNLKTIVTVNVILLLSLFLGNLIAWLERKSPNKIKNLFTKSRIFPLPLIISLETIIFYLVTIIPIEYLLTEKYFVLKFIYPRQKTTIFLIIFAVVFLANYFRPKFKMMGQRRSLFLVITLFIVLFTNQTYANFYNRLQETPKIYSLSSDWSIVGMEIEVDGKNFGSAWQMGKVRVDDFEFQIKDWTEENIVVIQPHPPQFFTGEFYVEKYDGKISNRLPFTVRSPGELHQ